MIAFFSRVNSFTNNRQTVENLMYIHETSYTRPCSLVCLICFKKFFFYEIKLRMRGRLVIFFKFLIVHGKFKFENKAQCLLNNPSKISYKFLVRHRLYEIKTTQTWRFDWPSAEKMLQKNCWTDSFCTYIWLSYRKFLFLYQELINIRRFDLERLSSYSNSEITLFYQVSIECAVIYGCKLLFFITLKICNDIQGFKWL